jgi:hypothetical protein
MRLRIIVAISLALVALSVLADPYTHNLNGSDAILPAPTWQTVAAFADIGLLIAAAIMVLRSLYSGAAKVLAIEFLYALGFNYVLLNRDGIERFIWGFGAERHTIDFIVVFALRLLVLLALVQTIRRRERRAA